jgi:hypothetical protein
MGIVGTAARGSFLTLSALGVVVTGVALLARCGGPPGAVEVPEAAVSTTGGICIGTCEPDPGSAAADCSQEDAVDTLVIESFDNFGGTNGSSAQDWYTYTDGTAILNFSATPALGSDPNAPLPSVNNLYYPDPTIGIGSGFEPPIAPPPAAIAGCHQDPDPSITPANPMGSQPPGVFHIFGGPFLGWGGGMGLPLAKLNGRDSTYANGSYFAYQENARGPGSADPNAPKDNCCVQHPHQTDCTITSDPRYAALCPPDKAPDGTDTEYAVYVATVDASQYEGVSFWARRGPNSQAGIRVMVGDKYTDDDINYLALRQQTATGQTQPTYCHRNRECACRNQQQCNLKSYHDLCDAGNNLPNGCSSPSDTQKLVCGLPTHVNFLNSCLTSNFNGVGFAGGPSVTCDVDVCNNVYPAYPCDALPDAGRFAGPDAGSGQPGDIQFYGRPCTPYQFENGLGSSYCYDPSTDPPPWPSPELCGDFWMTTVDLTTNWQFFKVPFTKLRQQGWAKKAEAFDLHSASVVRFSWDIGWIDYWVDRVSFYREKTSGSGGSSGGSSSDAGSD